MMKSKHQVLMAEQTLRVDEITPEMLKAIPFNALIIEAACGGSEIHAVKVMANMVGKPGWRVRVPSPPNKPFRNYSTVRGAMIAVRKWRDYFSQPAF